MAVSVRRRGRHLRSRRPPAPALGRARAIDEEGHGGEEGVRQGGGEQHLPAEPLDLVVAEARQGPADGELEVAEEEDLREEDAGAGGAEGERRAGPLPQPLRREEERVAAAE